jgi:hypothetical protein
MSDIPDPLETELAALVPHELSAGMRRRVAERVAQGMPARRRWVFALAAACIVAAALAWWGSSPRVVPPPIAVLPVPIPVPAPVVAEDAGPTLLAYRRALAESPAALDALLDRHAAAAPALHPELVEICAFTRSEAALHALVGDD